MGLKNIFNGSTLSSIIRYFQSVGMTLSIDFLIPPEKLQKFIDAITGFFDQIYAYIPDIPDFDVRFNFVFFSTVLPIVLYLLMQWITLDDIIQNIGHTLDVFAVFVFFFHIAHLVFSHGHEYWGTYVFMIFSVLWACFRGYQWLKRDKKKKENIVDIIEDIRKYYMQDIIPEYTSDLTEEKIYEMCEKYNSNIMLEPITPSPINMTFIAVLIVVFIIIILVACGVFPNVIMSSFFKWVFIIVSIIFILLLIFIALMIIVPSWRSTFVTIRVFFKNIFLFLFLMCFDYIYIPICKAFLELFYITDIQCKVGEYLPIPHEYDNFTQVVSNYIPNLTCVSCTTLVGACSQSCDGSSRVYNTISPQLLFYDDIVKTTAPAFVFAAIFIIIGLPILWGYLISHNRRIMWSVPAFGATREQKWDYLTHNMDTSSLNLFYMYKPAYPWWDILIMCSKLIFVILVMLTERANMHIAWVSLVGYLGLFALNWVIQPYMVKFNNALDSIVAFGNALLTLVPICAIFGKQVPSSFSVPLSVLVCVLPVVSVVYVVLCKPKSIAGEIYDPFACYDENGNKVESIIDDNVIMIPSIHFLTIWQIEELKNLKIHDDCEETISEDEKDMKDNHDENGDTITVKANLLKDRIEKMEKRIDQICDATCSDEMLFIINIISLFAAFASGFFFGAMYGEYVDQYSNICH